MAHLQRALSRRCDRLERQIAGAQTKLDTWRLRLDQAREDLAAASRGEPVAPRGPAGRPRRDPASLVCNVDGCETRRVARGWCMRHYGQARRAGNPLAPPTYRPLPRLTPEERFWSYIEKTPTCWLWRGSSNSQNGFPHINMPRLSTFQYAHQVVCELEGGPVPEKPAIFVQACGTRDCVRWHPDHWHAGTYSEMAHRRNARFMQRGHRNNSPLVYAEVAEIRRLAAAGTPQKELALRFGVGRTAISNIVLQLTWRVAPAVG